MSKNSKLLIILNTIRRIVDIFLGPFLTAYFFKLTIDNIKVISLYNILCYSIIMVLSFVVGYIIKNKYKLFMFRFGMIMKLLQLIILFILGKNVINYLSLVALISGISTITWAFSLNLFSSKIIENKEKKNFVVYKTVFTNIVNVIVPFLFGSLITINSFEKTLIIVIILSIIQIILSFMLGYKEENMDNKFSILNTYRELRKNSSVINIFKTDFFLGLTSEGALDTIVTLLIIISFNKDITLGLITSLSYIFSILSAYLCKKIKENNIKMVVYISSIVPIVSTLLLVVLTDKMTVIIYSIIYVFFIQILSIVKSTKTLKITNSNIINDTNREESYALFEFFLGIGRVMSYLLLLVVGILHDILLLKVLLILLSVCILFMGRYLLKIEGEDL